jgi:hypothetical protein
MKIVVTGDRHWTDRTTVEIVMRLLLPVHDREGLTIIAGGAPGLDTIAAEVAEAYGYEVDVFEADWDLYGRKAGPIRNKAMLDTEPDFVLAFHDEIEKSKGTRNCVKEAEKREIPVILLQSEKAALISDSAASPKDIETFIQ